MFVDHFNNLPHTIRSVGFLHPKGEWAYPKHAALELLEYFTQESVAVLGGEVWIPREHRIVLIPSPIFYVWDAGDKQPLEEWGKYVERANRVATDYISTFGWAREDEGKYSEPYFNLTAVDQNEYRELR